MKRDMPRVIGIFHTSPVYAIGLADVLSGFQVENIAELMPWVMRHRGSPVLVGVHDAADLDLVVEVKAADPASIMVTILDPLEVETVRASLRAGATGSVDLGASPEAVKLALRAAIAECTVLPTRLTRRMAGDQVGGRPFGIAANELDWLHALFEGETVAALGRRIGYSEREMYRRLRRLYVRMGVSGRTEALVSAARWGVLG
jgi:DNA-binding NarL/FixJ family response regulator